MTRVLLQVKAFDDLLGGGVEAGAVTELFGEAGTGKTNICLQLARNVAREGKRVVYIDTEGVSIERLRQMCGADFEDINKRILFFEPLSLREQGKIVEKTVRLVEGATDVGLVVVDSATVFYRLGLGRGDGVQERRDLDRQVHELQLMARSASIPVVLTNQVYTDVEAARFEAIGGQFLRHLTKAVVRLEKPGSEGLRRASIVKHRSRPEGAVAMFRIGAHGLEDP